MHISCIFALILAGPVASQINFGVPGSEGSTSFSGSKLCNGTFAEANSTGIISLSPSVGPNDSISWASTAYQDNTTTELSLWFSPNGKNYSDNFNLGYDVCYLWLKGLSLRATEQGQSDTGRCLSTLDQTCSTDLSQLTIQTSTDLDQAQTRTSTTGPNILSTRCASLASHLTRNFPASCSPYFDTPKLIVTGSLPQLGGPLTGPDSLLSRARCRLNGSYSLLWTQFGDPNNVTWYTANWWITPFITAFIPVADANRPITIGAPKAVLTCLRANTLGEGSVAVPSLNFLSGASSTGAGNGELDAASHSMSDGSKKGLSVGAVAGVSVAAVFVVALIGGVLACCARRTRNRLTTITSTTTSTAEYATWTDAQERERDVEVSELEPPLRLKGSVVSEMDAPKVQSELASFKDPVELPARLDGRC